MFFQSGGVDFPVRKEHMGSANFLSGSFGLAKIYVLNFLALLLILNI